MAEPRAVSVEHHVEIFREDMSGEWGWQCFTPGCCEEATGFEDFDAADTAADEHVAASRSREEATPDA